jgi:hypothetical protein
MGVYDFIAEVTMGEIVLGTALGLAVFGVLWYYDYV